jgi:hypothetical protein
MKQKTVTWIVLLLAALAAAGSWWWWQQQLKAAAPAPVSTPVAIAPPAAIPPAASAPAILHPIEAAAPASAPASASEPRSLPGADQAGAYVTQSLIDLLGRKSALTYLVTDRFVAQVVATVDNLDRSHAAARLWPVTPTPQQFITTSQGAGPVIGADNAQRYAAMVQFLSSVNTAQAVALYRHLYPYFQSAYEELGYPSKYFNDRLVQVIDHLLQTPEPAEPVAVKLTEVKGPIASTRPWVRYEYADPALEARSSGQKILMRLGTSNARQLKAKLAEFRRAVAVR